MNSIKIICIMIISLVTFSLSMDKSIAEVAGMDLYDLKYDYDFKRAVKDISEDNIESKISENDYHFQNAVKNVINGMSDWDFKTNSQFKNSVKNIIEQDCYIYADYNNKIKIKCN